MIKIFEACLALTSKVSVHSAEEAEWIFEGDIPYHIAIIMDGNRRWAARKKSNKDVAFGHWAGAENIFPIVEAASALGIKELTFFGFSTENWQRPLKEVDMLFQIFEIYLKQNKQKMIDQGVRFHTIGNFEPFSDRLKELILDVEEATRKSGKIDLIIAFNYGSQDEIVRAMKKIFGKIKEGLLSIDQITPDLIGAHLDTARWRDPDLFIRTSGEMRISNFLLWQLAYTEIYITDVLWPDFTSQDLLEAVGSYRTRKRRYGL
ncbi:MAG: di-trans,poly-cis-decaprenylcistransferase [Chlamydiia bacterium]|nr:di-trans,poly-cis-decaprenylcistransferase [Chlamydiia bacterium]